MPQKSDHHTRARVMGCYGGIGFCHARTRLESCPKDAGLARAGEQPVFAKVWAVEGVASFMAGQAPAQGRRRAEREFQACRRPGGRGGGKIARVSKRCTWLQPSSSSAPALRLRKTQSSLRPPLAGTPRRVEATFTCRALPSIQVETGMAAGINEDCQPTSFHTATRACHGVIGLVTRPPGKKTADARAQNGEVP